MRGGVSRRGGALKDTEGEVLLEISGGASEEAGIGGGVTLETMGRVSDGVDRVGGPLFEIIGGASDRVGGVKGTVGGVTPERGGVMPERGGVISESVVELLPVFRVAEIRFDHDLFAGLVTFGDASTPSDETRAGLRLDPGISEPVDES